MNRPTDRALNALGRPLVGCSGYLGGKHAASCPAAHGLEDDLPQTPEPTGSVGTNAATAGATP